jgi:threonylcarbamoyladenosine tRNA methylthiotransferase MtaB
MNEVILKKVAITTLGCRTNQYDSSAIADDMKKGGYKVVSFDDEALAYVINTCTVTGKTDYQSRQLIRRARRKNPEAVIIVTGCYAQVSPDEIREIPGVDYVLGNTHKTSVFECIEKGRGGDTGAVVSVGDYEDGAPMALRASSPEGRTRINMKIQDGCNRACAFCIIPMARGRSKSLPPDEVLSELDELVLKGFKEIIFTGIHLGAYGLDLSPSTSVQALLRAVSEKKYQSRFRISSLDPDEVNDELVDILSSSDSICKHLHLPLQSGDDKILRLMNRPYSREDFSRIVCNLHDKVDGIAIGTDIITGFPGEGEEEFENTYELLSELPLAYMHVFPYSKRKRTQAESMPLQVNGKVIKERAARLRELDEKMRRAFYNKFLGKRVSVLFEARRDKKTGFLKGRSDNYIPVFLDAEDNLKGALRDVRLIKINNDGMLGACVSKKEDIREEAMKAFLDSLSFSFKDEALLQNVFVHRSYLNEKGGAGLISNERLEFLGDSVLSVVVSKMLFIRFPEMEEGELTTIRSRLVNKKTLSGLAKDLKLGQLVHLGKGEARSGGMENPTILADVFEAFVGAVYLDSGLCSVTGFIEKLVEPLLDDALEGGGHFDFKPRFQEVAQRLFKETPTYRVTTEEGPPHKRLFTVEAVMDGKVLGTGRATTKKEAEQAAAREAISNIGE